MASNALSSLTCPTSPLVSCKASRSPLSAGFGLRQNNFVMMMGRPLSSRRLSLVVRAQDDPLPAQDMGSDPLQGGTDPNQQRGQVRADPSGTRSPKTGHFTSKPALLGSFRYVRDPWQTIDEGEKVVIKVDLPDLSPDDIGVRIEGKKLIIVDNAKRTLNHEIAFLLPDECLGTKNPKAKLDKRGVLTVVLDKVTSPEAVTPIIINVESYDEI